MRTRSIPPLCNPTRTARWALAHYRRQMGWPWDSTIRACCVLRVPISKSRKNDADAAQPTCDGALTYQYIMRQVIDVDIGRRDMDLTMEATI